MSWEQELTERVRKALEESAKESREGRSFETEWETTRAEVILPVLETAVRVMENHHISASAKSTNGTTLLAIKFEGAKQETLSFAKTPNKSEVICKSSFGSFSDEPYTSLDSLTKGVVQEKVNRFVDEVIRGWKGLTR
jgi:hypothetical protein